MTTTTKDINTRIDELAAERETAKGAAKGQFTKKIRKLEAERDELYAKECQADSEPPAEVREHQAQDDAPVGLPSDTREREAEAMVEVVAEVTDKGRVSIEMTPEAEAAGPHIVDSEKINGTRYSIDTDGNIWAPDGDKRCGTKIGVVLREALPDGQLPDGQIIGKLTGKWDGTSEWSDEVFTARSRKAVLIAIVAAASAVAVA